MTAPGPRRLLYAEDDADIRAIAKVALEDVGGFILELCASGTAALEAAPRFRPDGILLDVMMPGLDGPSTLLELRKNPELAHIPIVFLTAKAQPGEVARYKALGAVGVIIKPFDPMTLAQEVARLCEGHWA